MDNLRWPTSFNMAAGGRSLVRFRHSLKSLPSSSMDTKDKLQNIYYIIFSVSTAFLFIFYQFRYCRDAKKFQATSYQVSSQSV